VPDGRRGCHGELTNLSELFLRALNGIGAALDVRVIHGGRDGEPIDLGPDHYARLAAVGALIKVMTAARPVPNATVRRDDDGAALGELEASLCRGDAVPRG
jgi:hypothetical protein